MAAPMTPLVVPHQTADHEIAARIARAANVHRRLVRSDRDLVALVSELRSWDTYTRDLLSRRFASRAVVQAYEHNCGPLLEPSTSTPLPAAAASVREQLQARVQWLERLRARLHDYETTAEVTLAPASPTTRIALMVDPRSSHTPAIRNALGPFGHGATEEFDPEDLVVDIGHAEHLLEGHSAVVVVLEHGNKSATPSAASLLAAGWALGAVGPAHVVLVADAEVEGLPEGLQVLRIDRAGPWRAELTARTAAASID